MTFKLLIDECLVPSLTVLAWEAEHEATSVRDRDWCGLKDYELMAHVIDGDYTLVTHNSKDFRGPAGTGKGGLHRQQSLHAGLICLNSVHSMTVSRQQRLFKRVLEELENLPDLIGDLRGRRWGMHNHNLRDTLTSIESSSERTARGTALRATFPILS